MAKRGSPRARVAPVRVYSNNKNLLIIGNFIRDNFNSQNIGCSLNWCVKPGSQVWHKWNLLACMEMYLWFTVAWCKCQWRNGKMFIFLDLLNFLLLFASHLWELGWHNCSTKAPCQLSCKKSLAVCVLHTFLVFVWMLFVFVFVSCLWTRLLTSKFSFGSNFGLILHVWIRLYSEPFRLFS